MEEKTKDTIKKIVVVIIFGIIVYLAIIFIIATWIVFVVLFTMGLALFGAYTAWDKYAKNELMKKEENFDELKD